MGIQNISAAMDSSQVNPPFISVMEDPQVAKKAKQHLALQVADVITSLGVIAKGGVELNPLLKLSPKHPVASIVIPKIVLLAMGKKELENTGIEEKGQAKKILNALNMFYLVLVANNTYQLLKK